MQCLLFPDRYSVVKMAIHRYQGAHLEEPVCHKKNKIAFCLLSVPFSAVEDAVSVCGDKSESGGVSGVGKAVPSPELALISAVKGQKKRCCPT